MFRQLIEALKRKPLLTQMFGEMEQMLESGAEMFHLIASALTGKEQLSQATHDRVYEIDHGINQVGVLNNFQSVTCFATNIIFRFIAFIVRSKCPFRKQQ